jgi:hypothetical protein
MVYPCTREGVKKMFPLCHSKKVCAFAVKMRFFRICTALLVWL